MGPIIRLCILWLLVLATTTCLSFGDSNENTTDSGQLSILSTPLTLDTSIYSPFLQYLNLFGQVGIKFGIVAHTMGLKTAIMYYSFDPPFWPLGLMGNSYAELKFWALLAQNKLMREISEIPGVKRIGLLAGSQIETKWLLMRKQKQKMLVLLETDKPIDQNDVKKWSEAIGIDNPKDYKLKVTFRTEKGRHKRQWKIPLDDIKAGKAVVNPYQKTWENTLKNNDSRFTLFQRYFTQTPNEGLGLDITLVAPDGTEKDLGPLFEGGLARNFLVTPRMVKWRNAVWNKVRGIEPSHNEKIGKEEKFLPYREVPVLTKDQATCWQRVKAKFGRVIVK